MKVLNCQRTKKKLAMIAATLGKEFLSKNLVKRNQHGSKMRSPIIVWNAIYPLLCSADDIIVVLVEDCFAVNAAAGGCNCNLAADSFPRIVFVQFAFST